MKPTYEELEAKLERTEQLLAKTEQLLKLALEEIAKLKERLNRNSTNSSKPPSTDQKGNTENGSGKNPKNSHPGKFRSLLPPDQIDKHIQCTQENCPHCGSSKLCATQENPEILQQAELPEIQAIVTEYLLHKYQCLDCKKNSTAPLPLGIPDSAFGPKLMGLMATLTGVLHVAKREAIQLVKDLYGIDMGVGSISNIEERVSAALDPVYDRIHKFMLQHKFCTHFDETSWRDQGKRHFAWIATSQHAAVYRIDRNRSTAAFQRLIGQGSWTGPAVSDRYAVYNSCEEHQYCFAHLIREFRGYAEREEPDKMTGMTIEKELRLSCKIHREYREGKISLELRNKRLGARKRNVNSWLMEGFANGSDSLSKLCDVLLSSSKKLWAFTRNPSMDPTNNIAERDLRKLVVWRKKSYGTRSERGKKFVERITTVAQTVRKQAGNVLHFVQQAVSCFYLKVLPPMISREMSF